MSLPTSLVKDLELGLTEEGNRISATFLNEFNSGRNRSATSVDSASSQFSTCSTCETDTSVGKPQKTGRVQSLLSAITRVQVPLNTSASHVLPTKAGPQRLRNFRWIIFTTYRRLFTLAFLANIGFLMGLAARHRLDYANTATAASVNLVVSVLMRQEHVINILFWLSSGLPIWLPLWLRCRFAKIYCYGGLHSGCGITAAAWYVAFTTCLTQAALRDSGLWPATGIAYAVLVLLVLIVGVAHPTLRMKMHDRFEMVHRFAGWIVIAVYWAQIMLLVHQQTRASQRAISFGRALIDTPAFWCVCILTGCLFYPWIRLRKRTVFVEKLSHHAARLHFNHARVGRGIGVRLSTNPLIESHAFATIPISQSAGKGFSVVISNAGDWTRAMIRDPQQRTKIWMKGAPVYGVLRTALIFKRTVIVATGSGIGPCLSLLSGNDNIDCRVVWSTKAPMATYGKLYTSNTTRCHFDAVP